jgi:hypothetical protein
VERPHDPIAGGAAARLLARAWLRARAWLLTDHGFVVATVLLVFVAAVIRVLCTLDGYLLPNSDQAMVGLMARHILAGEWPIFYWGQPYNGTLESYLTALVYRLGGQDYMAIHIAPICFSLLFLVASVLLARRLYGKRLGLLTGLYLAAGPAELLNYSVSPGYNYLEAMACGTLALALLLGLETGACWRLPTAAFLVVPSVVRGSTRFDYHTIL